MTAIAAALCWYDEDPRILRRLVRSLAGNVDILVTLDGPYLDYPAGRVSPLEQGAAIQQDARLAMLPHDSMIPVADTQTGKRTHLYQHAAMQADWILIIDADEELRVTDPRELRRRLDGFDAATVLVQTGAACAVHPRLIRSMDAITCGPEYHGMLSATGEDGRRVCIRDRRELIMGEHPRPRRAREVDVSDLVTIINHTDDRPEPRIAAKREYVKRRRAAGRDL